MARFPDNARVCFVGDSITAQNRFVSHIVEYYTENFGDRNINIYNSGIAGGRAGTALMLIDEDTLCHKPTHAVVMTGVNDSERWHLSQPRSKERYERLERAFEIYKKELPMLCEKLLSEGVSVTLCTPPPYAEYEETSEEPLHGGYALMLGYAEFCRAYAKEKGLPLCDIHAYMTKRLEEENIYGADHIHPNEKGQYYLAKCFLEYQGFELPEKTDIPAYLDEWRRLVGLSRDIFGVDTMLISRADHALPNEKKIELMKAYLAEKRYGNMEYFKKIAEEYVENKGKEQEYLRLADRIMEVELKNR